MAQTRTSLPVFTRREAILRALQADVSIVEGETGSGKTTQVPQYLLEEASRSGEPVSVIVTQPRRVAAIGVADRVAAERGEMLGEGAVGYAVRGESRQNSDTSLLFCTTGVLLRMLEEDSGLSNVTHVLIDEVHERSVENDFLLLTLRMLLLRRREAAKQRGVDEPGSERPLKICLMSATLDSDVLTAYFDSEFAVESVSFPGAQQPVCSSLCAAACAQQLVRSSLCASSDLCCFFTSPSPHLHHTSPPSAAMPSLPRAPLPCRHPPPGGRPRHH